MTVAELIKHLKTFPQELQVVYSCCSEQCLMKEDDIYIASLGLPRPDGWVANKRPDKDCMEYLCFPGN